MKPTLPRPPRRARFPVFGLLLCLLLAACGGGGGGDGLASGGNGPLAGAPPLATLSVSAGSEVVAAGGEPVTLSASLDDARWTLEAGSPGRLDAQAGASVRYIPPPAGSVDGSTVIHVTASAAGMRRQLSIVLEDGAAGGAPLPDPVTPSRLVIGSDATHVAAGGSGVMLDAVGVQGSSVQWSLVPGSPGSLSASSGATVTYLPPPVAPASAVPVTVRAQSDGQQAAVSLLLEGEQGLSLLAGNDYGAGDRDGAGAGARFSTPRGIARDAQGNLYIADTGNHVIRRVAPDNSVTTIAGVPDEPGHVDGSGADARLEAPAHLTLGADGNLYLTDSAAHTVRRITPAGTVTTVAGRAGEAGDADGIGRAARFNVPKGIEADLDGNLFVADSHNSLVRRIAPDGTVGTYAGIRGERMLVNGTLASATFIDPQTLAVDMLGNVTVIDGWFRHPEPNTLAGRSVIRKLATDGTVTTLAGAFIPETAEAVDGTREAARFFTVHDLVADVAGNLVLGDARLRHVTPEGVVGTLLADGAVGQVAGVALDSTGTVYFTDAANHVVRALEPDGDVLTLAGASPQAGSADGIGANAQFRQPEGVAVDAAGNVYVADKLNHTVRVVSAAGLVRTLAGSAGTRGSADGAGAAARFDYPEDVAAAADGTLYVADAQNHAVRRIAPDGMVTTLAGGVGNPPYLGLPNGIALGPDGNVYVSDLSNAQILRITQDGEVSALAGNARRGGHADGTGEDARFSAPGALTVDAAGNLFVLDAGSTVRRVTPQGVVTTLAGSPGQWGQADGSGSQARFRAARGLAIDADGILYVADTGNHALRRITPEGMVTTVAGRGAPDNLAAYGLYRPVRVAVLGEGELALTSGNGVFRLRLP